MEKTTKLKHQISDFVFGVWYVLLFALQAIPHFAIVFNAPTVWVVITIVIGSAALIAQFVKFPCFMTRTYNSAMIGLTIAAFIMKGMV